MKNIYQENPFGTRFTYFRFPQHEPELPFVVGGGTQAPRFHQFSNINNQDAANIAIGRDYFIGIVCDGCASTHEDLENDSSNEVGAKLLSYVFTQRLLRALENGTRFCCSSCFEKALLGEVSADLSSFLSSFCKNEQERELFTFNFLLCTVLGFVVTPENYIVFHAGDGVIGVNNCIHLLEDDEGYYIGNDLIKSFRSETVNGHLLGNNLKIIAMDQTQKLKNIFLATDGFYDMVSRNTSAFVDWMTKCPSASQIENGYDDLLPEFREKIGWNESINTGLRDDATFLLLRRTCKDSREEKESHDTN